MKWIIANPHSFSSTHFPLQKIFPSRSGQPVAILGSLRGQGWGPREQLRDPSFCPMPLTCQRWGEEQMAWGGGGDRPSVPSPPLSPEPRGMGRGCGPLRSGSAPSIFLEGAEELVSMETGRGKRDAGRDKVSLRAAPWTLPVTFAHTTQVQHHHSQKVHPFASLGPHAHMHPTMSHSEEINTRQTLEMVPGP